MAIFVPPPEKEKNLLRIIQESSPDDRKIEDGLEDFCKAIIYGIVIPIAFATGGLYLYSLIDKYIINK